MEYIDGFSIGNLERIPEGEYNVDEIGSKLTENYIKQVIDDGFFHAGKGNADDSRRSGKYITRYQCSSNCQTTYIKRYQTKSGYKKTGKKVHNPFMYQQKRL